MLKNLLVPAPVIARSIRRLANPPPSAVPRQAFDVGWIRGRVTRYVEQWLSETTHGGGDGHIGMHKGTGSGYIKPVWSRTDRWKRIDWDINDNGKRYPCWLEHREDVIIREGDEVGVLFVNAKLTQIVNYTDDLVYCITPCSNLISQASVDSVIGCLVMSLVIAPLVTFYFCKLIMVPVKSLYIRLFGSWESSWLYGAGQLLGGIFILTVTATVLVRLFVRRRQSQQANVQMWQQGCADLAAWCKKGLGVDGHWP